MEAVLIIPNFKALPNSNLKSKTKEVKTKIKLITPQASSMKTKINGSSTNRCCSGNHRGLKIRLGMENRAIITYETLITYSTILLSLNDIFFNKL